MKAIHATALLLVGLLTLTSGAEAQLQPLSTQWLNNVHSGNQQTVIRRHRRLLSSSGTGPSTVPLMLPNVKLAVLRQGGTSAVLKFFFFYSSSSSSSSCSWKALAGLYQALLALEKQIDGPRGDVRLEHPNGCIRATLV